MVAVKKGRMSGHKLDLKEERQKMVCLHAESQTRGQGRPVEGPEFSSSMLWLECPPSPSGLCLASIISKTGINRYEFMFT